MSSKKKQMVFGEEFINTIIYCNDCKYGKHTVIGIPSNKEFIYCDKLKQAFPIIFFCGYAERKKKK